jgi:hypothetical protein
MIPIPQPQWIAKMYPSRVGRDHLGLGSVSSDQILPTLSPGINVLTVHPRYHSFYTFLLDEFWRRRDRPRSYRNWVSFYRPREFIYSVGAYLCDQPEHADMRYVVGGQKTAPLAAQQLTDYNTNFHYIDSELGGYGLYYRSVIIELGLVIPGGAGFPLPVDFPSEKGKQVADAFRQAVQTTKYYTDYFDQDQASVPIEVIREYIRRACLCQLQRPDTPDRPLLLDTFLHAGGDRNASARRATFRLFLDMARQNDASPIGQDVFRQLVYFGTASNRCVYRPSEALLDVWRRWRLYQAREYYSFALNALWCYLCDWGVAQAGDIRPVPLADLWAHLDAELDFAGLAARFALPAPDLRATSDFQRLLDWLISLVGASDEAFDAACGLQSPLHEHRLYELALGGRSVPDGMIAGMITMLALIYLRFGHPQLWLKAEWEVSRMGSDGRLSLDGFMRFLRERLRSGPITIGEFARWIYNDYIILQHQLVATAKLPDNTFRFERDGDRLRFYVLDNALGFTDSRFDALRTAVHELGFCGNFYGAVHPLTPDGQQLLDSGDLS